jgi:hypothetical protein
VGPPTIRLLETPGRRDPAGAIGAIGAVGAKHPVLPKKPALNLTGGSSHVPTNFSMPEFA